MTAGDDTRRYSAGTPEAERAAGKTRTRQDPPAREVDAEFWRDARGDAAERGIDKRTSLCYDAYYLFKNQKPFDFEESAMAVNSLCFTLGECEVASTLLQHWIGEQPNGCSVAKWVQVPNLDVAQTRSNETQPSPHSA